MQTSAGMLPSQCTKMTQFGGGDACVRRGINDYSSIFLLVTSFIASLQCTSKWVQTVVNSAADLSMQAVLKR